MKYIIIFFLSWISLCLQAQIPFEQYPSFETNPSGHYGTGLGIADINNDGWKDIIVANGNDIQRQRLVVYYNNGDGTFPADPDWQSSDIDYHGHLSAGDIDNDGDIDVAVSVYIGASGFSSPGKLKVYYNSGTELESLPNFQSSSFYTFSCALGDADGDGDLDLAAACGEPYGSIYDHGRIYYNDNGTFSESNVWMSEIQMGGMDVEFGDVDQNGFLDLIFVSEELENYIFLSDNAGNINSQWDWVSDHPLNYMNSVDFGKPCATSDPCFVATGNNQLGGDGKIKQFSFPHPLPQSSPPNWESAFVGYGSGILMAEINNDENLDLLYGSWWGPLRILEGDCGFWNTTPAYVASESSVVEAILMSDLGKFNYQSSSKTIKSITEQSVIYLDQQIIEKINAVSVNGTYLDRADYCYVELKNWVSFKDNIMPGDVVTIEYEYMLNGDIVISNWDSGKGNFIYYNTNNPVGLAETDYEAKGLHIKDIYPQPAFEHINFTIEYADETNIQASIFDLSGQLVLSGNLEGKGSYSMQIASLKEGIYILEISDGASFSQRKIIIGQ